MKRETYISVTALMLLFGGLVHFFRILYGWQVVIGGVEIPIWASWIGVLVAIFLVFSAASYSTKK